MASILIRGGDSESAARDMSAAVGEVIGELPIRLEGGLAERPIVRGLIETALIVLALPPALVGSADIIARMRLQERLKALISKADQVSKTTKSSVLIDPGDGKHIPLEEASREAIVAALTAVEKRLKG